MPEYIVSVNSVWDISLVVAWLKVKTHSSVVKKLTEQHRMSPTLILRSPRFFFLSLLLPSSNLLKRSLEEGALIKSWLLILSSKGKLNTKWDNGAVQKGVTSYKKSYSLQYLVRALLLKTFMKCHLEGYRRFDETSWY